MKHRYMTDWEKSANLTAAKIIAINFLGLVVMWVLAETPLPTWLSLIVIVGLIFGSVRSVFEGVKEVVEPSGE